MLSENLKSQAMLIAQAINQNADEPITHAMGFEHQTEQERQDVLAMIQSLTAKKYRVNKPYPVSDHNVTEIHCGGRT